MLNNSRSEAATKTPTKHIQPVQRLTSRHTPPSQQGHWGVVISSSNRRPPSVTSDETDFRWSASNDTALVEAAQSAAMAPPETPCKTPRNAYLTSPGKRNHSEILETNMVFSTSLSHDDVFNTPSQDASGLLSPVETPLRENSHGGVCALADSNLVADALSILQSSKLSREVEQKLVGLLNKHELRTQGIVRGRDITRLALGSKEKKITELVARIALLEAERETSNAVIAHLKREIGQTSPSKGRTARG